MAKILLLFSIVSWLVISCATIQEPGPVIATTPTKVGDVKKEPQGGKNIVHLLKDVQLEIIPDNVGYRDGQPLIGVPATFQLVLKFSEALPETISPDRFRAHIGKLRFYFIKENGRRTYFTDILSIREPGLKIGPVKVAVFYRERGLDREIFHVNPKWVVIDTEPPPAPEGLRVEECGRDYFILNWKRGKGPGDVKEYAVQKLKSGTWVKLPPGSVSTPGVRVYAKPEGRIRVVAFDWARNPKASEELQVNCGTIQITGMKILAPVRDTSEALKVGKDRVVTGSDTLSLAYAVEVTAGRASKVLLVNVDSLGFGYRLYPTPCRTGKGFDGYMRPSEPMRYPALQHRTPYIGLDEVKGIEDVYAILYEEDALKEEVWNMVINELCDYGDGPVSGGTPKGSRELPGIRKTGEKKKVFRFEKRLDELKAKYRGTMNWTKRSFWHGG